MKRVNFFILLIISLLYSNSLFSKYIRIYYVLYGNSTLGDCIYMEFPGNDQILGTDDDTNVIIDGGRLSDEASSYLDDFLNSKNITTINHMVLTHPDADHSSGLKMVMDNYVVENFYCTGQAEVDEMNDDYPNRISNEGCSVFRISTFTATTGKHPWECYLSGPDCNYGPNWDSNVTVRVLSADNSETGNARSLVLKVSFGKSSFYFGGDAEGLQEDSIRTNAAEESPIDNFKVEHHGSDTNGSNNSLFIDWMKPKFAFIITGGHTVVNGPPADATLKRLMDRKVIIYRTDLDGTILLKADEQGNYDIVRMTAFNNLQNIDADSYDEVVPFPKAFPEHSNTDFNLGSQVSRTYVLPPPDLPTGLTVTSRDKYSVTLDWNYDNDSSIEGYFIFYSTHPGGDDVANNGINGWINPGMTEETGIYKRYNDTPINTHPYTVTGLSPNTFYYFRLSVITTYYYERRYSNEVSTKTLTPDPVAPEKIADLSAKSGDSHQEINLTWTSPHEDGTTGGEVSGYILRYATFSVSSLSGDTTLWWNLATTYSLNISVASTGTLQIANLSLKEGLTYYFAVKSYDDVNNVSLVSNEAFAFSPDFKGPVFLYSNVENYLYSFNPSSSCLIVFDEEIGNYNDNIYLIKLKDNLDNLLNEKILPVNINISGSTATYSFSLSYNSEYKLVISSSVTDIYNNKTAYKEILFRTLMRKQDKNIISRNNVTIELPENSMTADYGWIELSTTSFTGEIDRDENPYLKVLKVYDIKLKSVNNNEIKELNESAWITLPSETSLNETPYSYEDGRWVRVVYWEKEANSIKFKTPHLSYFSLMSEANYSLNIKCYPNPAKDYVKFTGLASYTKIKFYTIDGRLKKEVLYDYNAEKTFTYKININFPSGLYFWEAVSYEGDKVKDRETGRLVVIK